MSRIRLLLVCFFLSIVSIFSFAQVTEEKADHVPISNTTNNIKTVSTDSIKYYNPTIQSYKYWTEDNTKQIFDTVLTIDKYYRNKMYNHKDSFGVMPFSNIGHTFNPLLYTTKINSAIDLIPIGKSFNLIEADEVRYFDVQTPMTEFQYNNGYKQGHSLSSLFTHNINSRLNYSVQYRGLRSEGKYLEQLASNNTLLFTVNYHTKNQKYNLWSHYITANVDDEENGGIQFPKNFEDGDSKFKDRDRMEVNLTGAQSKYGRRRFYVGQQLGIINSGQYRYPLSIKNIFTAESSHYSYEEFKALNTFFADREGIFEVDNLKGHYNIKKLRKITNLSTVVYDWTDRLHVEAGLKYEHLEFNFDRIVDSSIAFPKNLKDNRLGVAGKLTFNWKKEIVLKSQGEVMSGDQFKNSYYIDNHLIVSPIKNYYIEANLGIKSQMPSLNLLYNQSFYKSMNYFVENPENERTVQAGGELHLKPYNTRIFTQFYNIKNYTYLDSDNLPKQSSSSVDLVQVGIKNTFQYKKFHLETHLAYQNVTSNKQLLPLPDFIGRATVYYQSKAFKNNAEFQLGLNAYYFTKFQSRIFLPVTNEFRLQSKSENYNIGEYPVLDLFLHFKVKRMLIILEGQHFNSSFSGYKFYSSPLNPYTDFRLNVGILWYIFT
ncbi:putative porin [uncultured Apibacter sp.]|uniref:putative porin n=1 Tax=uncultured Apibacter sp. TaxID=1778616 RepID=UPI0025D3B3BE|nr:putative porin [uncultured Apibacter sp.]